ncbi:MAG TPA: Zn-ribbon domain-containing OB-fold protein [Thermoplasmata archaeon]|nr:Zn-ribbon domain-containing OB-fold protein [Thermoplasmata archaeon]
MSVPRFWREIPQRYNLIGKKCTQCGQIYFPPRDVCPKCRRESIGKMEDYKLKGTAKIFTYTIIHIAPPEFVKQQPYIMAIVELDEGPRLTAQLVDIEPENVKIGIRVKAVFRKIKEDGSKGVIYYGYKFKPIS